MTGMDISQLITDLKMDEGFRRSVYQDQNGLWTIGYGRMVDGRLGGGITPAEGDYLLSNDISRVVHEMDHALPWAATMTEARQRALANMLFEMGLHKLIEFKDMLAALQIGNYDEAAAQALNSKWAGQVPARAQRIAALFRHG